MGQFTADRWKLRGDYVSDAGANIFQATLYKYLTKTRAVPTLFWTFNSNLGLSSENQTGNLIEIKPGLKHVAG